MRAKNGRFSREMFSRMGLMKRQASQSTPAATSQQMSSMNSISETMTKRYVLRLLLSAVSRLKSGSARALKLYCARASWAASFQYVPALERRVHQGICPSVKISSWSSL